MMVRGILEPGAGHGIVGAVGSEALSRGQRQPSSGDLPEVPAEHRLVKERVRMPLVDEAFSPTAVGEFTASQGHPLEVDRRAEDEPAGRACQVRHQGRLGQIPLGAVKLAAVPVVRAPGGDHRKDLAHPDDVPVAQREPEHPVLHLVFRFGLHRVVHLLRGRVPREEEQEKKCRRGDGAGGRHGSVHMHEYLAIGTNIRERRPGRALLRLRCRGEAEEDRRSMRRWRGPAGRTGRPGRRPRGTIGCQPGATVHPR